MQGFFDRRHCKHLQNCEIENQDISPCFCNVDERVHILSRPAHSPHSPPVIPACLLQTGGNDCGGVCLLSYKQAMLPFPFQVQASNRERVHAFGPGFFP